MGDAWCREPLENSKAKLASPLARAYPGVLFNEHLEGGGAIAFVYGCALRLEGVVSGFGVAKNEEPRCGSAVAGRS